MTDSTWRLSPLPIRTAQQRLLTMRWASSPSYSINFIDRQLLSILQEAIKADLMLSDAQLVVTGFAFALFYTFAGLPIASLADRSNRRYCGYLAHDRSGMTAISGLAQNYWRFYWRVGVGIGEAVEAPLALDDFRFSLRKTRQCDRLLLDGHQHRHSIWLVWWLVKRILRLACYLLCCGCPRRHPRSGSVSDSP